MYLIICMFSVDVHLPWTYNQANVITGIQLKYSYFI